MSAGETPVIHFACGKAGDSSESDPSLMSFGDDFTGEALGALWNQTNTIGYGSGIVHNAMWLRPRYCMQRYQGIHNRTYVAWVNKSGELRIMYYDHLTKTHYGGPLGFLVDTGFLGDLHEAPNMVIPTSGPYAGQLFLFSVCFRAGELGNGLRIYRGDVAEDVTSFSLMQWIEYIPVGAYGTMTGYPQCVILGTGTMALFYEIDPVGDLVNYHCYYRTSTDGFTTISAATTLVRGVVANAWVYPTICQDGDVTHFATNGWHASIYEDIYYMKNTNNLADEYWFEADGTTSISGDGIPPAVGFNLTELELVYNADQVYMNDMVISGGVPFLSFVEYHDATTGHATWAHAPGGVWTVHQVDPTNCNVRLLTDANFTRMAYCTGCSLDPNDPTHVFVGVRTAAGAVIEEWHSPLGDGTDFVKYKDVSGVSTGSCYQPYCVRNYSDELKLLWIVNLDYTGPSTWNAYIAAASYIGSAYSLAVNKWHCAILRGKAASAGLIDSVATVSDPLQFDIQVLHLDTTPNGQRFFSFHDDVADYNEGLKLEGTTTANQCLMESKHGGGTETDTTGLLNTSPLKTLYFQSVRVLWAAHAHAHIYIDGFLEFSPTTVTEENCYITLQEGATASDYTFVDYVIARTLPADHIEPTWLMGDLKYGAGSGANSIAAVLITLGLL